MSFPPYLEPKELISVFYFFSSMNPTLSYLEGTQKPMFAKFGGTKFILKSSCYGIEK